MRASRFAAAKYGARVAVCEMPYARVATDDAGGAGGTCVLRGCVPKKLLVYGSEFAGEFRDAAGFGWDVAAPAAPDWAALQAAKNAELARLNGVYRRILEGAGVTYVEGRGSLVDAHTVAVGGKTYTARHVLLATGGRAWVPDFPGAEHCIISDQALDLETLPKKIAIIGGGYIAVEFASIFNNVGVDTHLVVRQDAVLRGFDEEVRRFAGEQYEARGVKMHLKASPAAVEKAGDGTLTLRLATPGGEVVLAGLDAVMAATGRRPNTKGLNLAKVGVATNPGSGAVVVDEFSRTSVPSVWAVGDVTDRINLTPVALMEGMAFARHVFGGDAGAAADHADVASAVFSSPPIAGVGLTEEEAAARGKVRVYSSSFRPMKNTISGNPGRSLMKIVVDAASDRVLGMHMVGPDCAEIMQGFAAAVKLGITKDILDTVVGIHPTAAEEFVTMRDVTRTVGGA